jgi:hypothetical protein
MVQTEISGSVPPSQTLDDYAVEQVMTDVGETSHIKVQSALEGFLINSFYNLVSADELAVGYNNLALKSATFPKSRLTVRRDRVGTSPFEKIREEVKERVLDPKNEILSPILIKQRLRWGLPQKRSSSGRAALEPAPASERRA